MQQYDVAIVGGGIVGIAHAYAAAKRGKSVVIFERHARAMGASIRNFGMIWPIGLTANLLPLGLRSRDLWRAILDDARLPYLPTGSLHLVYREDEEAVVREFVLNSADYGAAWLDAQAVKDCSPAANPDGLRGGLWSHNEITVDPRLVTGELPGYLTEKYDVTCRFGEPVRSVSGGIVTTAHGSIEAGHVIICSGEDFESLYPEVFATEPLRKCKLQMMRTAPQPDGWQLGPALAAGLTLRFYPAFRSCQSLAALEKRIEEETPEFNRWGIHVMASQTSMGEITIGDSHEYDMTLPPFDKPEIDEMILNYFIKFARLPKPEIVQRWHGIYANHPTKHFLTIDPEPGVRIASVTGGKGMTLSFGFGEQMIEELSL